MTTQHFPYLTNYINETFDSEKERFDYIYIRPILTIFCFVLRLVVVPFKFLFHRTAWGFEKKLIDGVLAFGIKYLAAHDALRLLIRHVQIEPVLYRFILSGTPEALACRTGVKMKGIDGDFTIDSIQDVVAHGLTICHDDLSYEVFERFDKEAFVNNLGYYRSNSPEDIDQFGREVLEQNRQHSWQIFGATNVVISIVITIAIFGDLQTVIRALNSFDSDSLVLWCVKMICANDEQARVNLDFYLQSASNRSHYNSSPFLSDPNEYLYHHIAFDEYVYELLRKQTAEQ